ncbi:MAG: hypothetical protein ACR2GM_07275 [Nocardioidaceae bacterium]
MNAFLTAVGVLGVSASGPLMAATAASAMAITFWRNALATALIAPTALLTRRTELRSLDRRTLALTLTAGALLAAHFATWVSSLKLTSVASATALVCFAGRVRRAVRPNAWQPRLARGRCRSGGLAQRRAGVTVCAQLLGHSVFNHLLAVVSPTVVSLVLLLEVPGAALLAGLFLGQTPPGGVYVGLALIMAGLALVVLRGQPAPGEVPLD